MPDEYANLSPEELERILRELAGGISESTEINPLPAPIGPTGELYQTLLEQIPAVTFMTSFEEGKQNVYVSPQIKEILGYTPEEWLGRPSLWQERLHPDDKERFQKEFSETVMSRGTAVHSVYRFVHRDGRIVWIQGDVRIKRDEATGFPLFVQAVGVDVTRIEEAKQKELDAKQKRIDRLQSEVHREFGPDALIGSSPAMEELRGLIRRVARSDASALISGESGTGKELVAHALHYSSRREKKEFKEVHAAGGVPTELVYSELFGHEKGAFTGATSRRIGKFEEADGGTLFLDEIGDMPLEVQVMLLKVLEQGSFTRLGGNETIRVDVRVICATNRNLEESIEKGRFRADLFYRINHVSITVPPLREHLSDVPELAGHFLASANREDKRCVEISDEAMRRLMVHHWPGNIRQLKHVVKGAFVICEENTILPDHLPPSVVGLRRLPSATTLSVKYYDEVEKVERSLIIRALEQSRGVKAEAARFLSLSPNTLTNRMTYFGIAAVPESPWYKEA